MPAAERQREGTSAITAATASPAPLHITHVCHVANRSLASCVKEPLTKSQTGRQTDRQSTDRQTAMVRKHAYITCTDMLRALHVCRQIDRFGGGGVSGCAVLPQRRPQIVISGQPRGQKSHPSINNLTEGAGEPTNSRMVRDGLTSWVGASVGGCIRAETDRHIGETSDGQTEWNYIQVFAELS